MPIDIAEMGAASKGLSLEDMTGNPQASKLAKQPAKKSDFEKAKEELTSPLPTSFLDAPLEAGYAFQKQTGLDPIKEPKKFEEWKKKNAPPDVPFTQRVKEFGHELMDEPLTSVVKFAKSFIADPEMVGFGAFGGPARGVVAGAVGMGGIEAAQEKATQGRVSPGGVEMAAAQGALTGGLAGLKGRAKLAQPSPKSAGEEFLARMRAVQEGKVPPAAEEPSIASDLEKVKKGESVGKPVIRETGFRNKETGNIIGSGPKHDEALKDDAAYEPGFVTSDGKFLTRQEAALVAPEDKLVREPSKGWGLHSTDFGKEGVPDRRTDITRRKRIAEMSPEEAHKELTTSPKTGLPNLRAYEEAPKKAFQASVDADSLKWINDTLGHEAGDELLTKIGRELKAAGLEVYHTGGDEFVVQGDSEKALRDGFDAAHAKLAEASIKGAQPDGTVVTKKGLGFTYGISRGLKEADQAMLQSKASREAMGMRAGRGQKPIGVEEIPPPGQPAQMSLPLESGHADPKLLALMGGTALGALLGMGYLGDPADKDFPSMVGKALEGGAAALLLAQSPSFFMRARYKPRAEFVRWAMRKHGVSRATAEKLFDEKNPPETKSPYMHELDERADVADIQYQNSVINGAAKGAHVETVMAIQQLRKEGWTPARLEPLWDVEEGKAVPKGLEGVYENYYKPAREALEENLREISKLTGRSKGMLEEEFMPRIALDRRGPLQRLFEGHTEFAGTGKPSSLHSRSIYSVRLPDGSDLVVHLGDKGHITGFRDGQILDLGFTKNGRRPQIGQAVELKSGHNLGELGQATRNQIETHTNDLRYWKDPIATVLMKRAETGVYLDRLKFFKELQNRPDFKETIAAHPDENPPENWRPLNAEAQIKLPMFRSLNFNPRYAELIEDLVKHKDRLGIISAFSNVATKALLLNPLPHIGNEFMHWVMASGITSFLNPAKVPRLIPAWRSVMSQDAVQMALNRAGANMLYTDRWLNRNVGRLGAAEKKLLEGSPEVGDLAKQIGLSPVEAANYLSTKTGDFMWLARDAMVTQLTLERFAKERGLSYNDAWKAAQAGLYAPQLEAAAEAVMQEMPSYRLPPRIAEDFIGEKMSRILSDKVMQNQLMTAFSRYHYAVVSELGRVARGIVSGKNAPHALDSLAALMAMYLGYQYLVDPAADALAKSFGMAQGKARRPGPLHMIEKAQNVAEGKPDAGLWLALSILSPPMWTPLAEAAFGRQFPTGRAIGDPNAPGYTQLGQRAQYLMRRLMPSVGGGMFNAPEGTIPKTNAQAILQQLDIESKTQEALDRINRAKRYREAEERRAKRKRRSGR